MARAKHNTLRALGAAACGVTMLAIARAARRRRSLEGQVAIVTGGSRGLGLCIAEELGRRGARVAICGRDARALEEAERRLRAQGIDVLARQVDLGDREQARSFVERAALEWERLDILVNNAGVIHVEPAQTASIESVHEAMNANFWSAANTTFAAIPHLAARGGGARIANVASIGGRVAVPHLLGYSASKFAMVGLSEGLAAELGRSGIRVTTVIPGLMRTGSFYNAEFAGDARRELAWFRAGASLPIFTVGARRAARRIVRAIAAGERVVHVGAPAMILARLHGLAPGLVIGAMSIVARLLPRSKRPPDDAKRGRDIPAKRRALFALGERAARENNEAPPP